jgi:hypothetical protein
MEYAYLKVLVFMLTQNSMLFITLIEIPTPRWLAHDAKRFNVQMPEGTKMVT